MWKKFLYLLDTQYGIKNPQMYAFHHSNPNITSLEECRYIACIKNEKSYNIYPKGDIGICSIVGGLYANIRFQGVYEDVLSLYKGIYHQWLPRSEFEALSSSAHVLYHKNNFIQEDETFDIEFRVPIRYK
jgi:AraC family transcriptional regulator